MLCVEEVLVPPWAARLMHWGLGKGWRRADRHVGSVPIESGVLVHEGMIYNSTLIC